MVHSLIAFPIILMTALGSALAQKVDLQGVIRDRYTSAPLSQARVTLVGLDLAATTDSSGHFRLLRTPTGIPDQALSPRLHSSGGRTIAFRCDLPGTFSLQLIGPSGQEALYAEFRAAEPGDWEIEMGSVPAGLYFARLLGPSLRLTAKVVLLAGNGGASRTSTLRRLPVHSRLAKIAAALDTLQVSRSGYRPTAFPIAAWEQADLAFTLSDTTVSMARLVALAPSAGALVPAFSPSVLAYTLSVPDTVVALRFTPDASPARPSIRVNGSLVASGSSSAPVALSSGSNRVIIEVVSRDSSSTTRYALDVLRAAPETVTIASLNLSAGTLTPAFHPNVLAYKAVIPFGISSITLTARPSHPSHIMLLGSTVLENGVPSLPIELIPVPRTLYLTLRASPSREVQYTIELSRPPDPGHDPSDASIASLVYSPSRPYLFPFRPDSTRQVSKLEWRDSVFDITVTLNNPAASLAFDRTPHAGGVPRRTVLPYGRTQVLVETRSPDGNGSQFFQLIFYRPKPLPTPVVSGPVFTLVGAPATYTATLGASPNCLGPYTIRHWFDFGDGALGYATPMAHAWAAPGTYPVRFRTSCDYGFGKDSLVAQSDWSEPLRVTVVSDTAPQNPVRRVSGYRPQSETWRPETTYVITGHTRFDSAAVLTILPGTRVQFLNDTTYLNVAKISAVGTPTDSIRFEVGEVRVQWARSGGLTYNPDGSYRAGPRFEFCSFPDSRLYVEYNADTYGGTGFYLKHSSVKTIKRGTWMHAVGTYIEHSRIGHLHALGLYQSRVLNSYFDTLRIVADRPSSVEIHRCDIRFLAIPNYEFDRADITGNTIGAFRCGSYAGILGGNNILPAEATAVAIATVGIDMRGNYWGPTVTAEMESKGANQDISVIRDIFDDVTLGKVDYGAWRTAPVPDARPDW